VTAAGAALPFFEVERARFGLYWKELIRGHVVATVDLLAPRLSMVEEKGRRREQSAKDTPKVAFRFEDLAPFTIDRAQVKDGEILWLDAEERKEKQAENRRKGGGDKKKPETTPQLWVHGIEGTLENFATRKALSKNEPTVLAARGTLQKTGKVSLFVTADPLAKQLTFAGQARLEGLQLAELGSLLAPKLGVTPEKGELDLSLRFKAVDGALTGGLRPILKDASTKQAEPGLGSKLKSLLADASLKIFSDDVPGRDAVATTIPIQGSVDDPGLQLVPTVLGIVRNAFVRGLADSMTGLPPPESRKPEGVLKQARRALSPERGNQPRAQPQGGDK
jgi:hypothetical protein